ncbi:hypothetical protein C8R43DRAFT_965275 [Mycena crocata]|nr:hypothetical protein C8R43DRAFT_965275 [Mycena crocata]
MFHGVPDGRSSANTGKERTAQCKVFLPGGPQLFPANAQEFGARTDGPHVEVLAVVGRTGIAPALAANANRSVSFEGKGRKRLTDMHPALGVEKPVPDDLLGGGLAFAVLLDTPGEVLGVPDFEFDVGYVAREAFGLGRAGSAFGTAAFDINGSCGVPTVIPSFGTVFHPCALSGSRARTASGESAAVSACAAREMHCWIQTQFRGTESDSETLSFRSTISVTEFSNVTSTAQAFHFRTTASAVTVGKEESGITSSSCLAALSLGFEVDVSVGGYAGPGFGRRRVVNWISELNFAGHRT